MKHRVPNFDQLLVCCAHRLLHLYEIGGNLANHNSELRAMPIHVFPSCMLGLL